MTFAIVNVFPEPVTPSSVSNWLPSLNPLTNFSIACGWVDPVHETILIDPVIYDSDIHILHHPHTMHAKRDFAMFEKHSVKIMSSRRKSRLMFGNKRTIRGFDCEKKGCCRSFSNT